MLRKRFSAALIAIIVAMAMPTGAFAGVSFQETIQGDQPLVATDVITGDTQQQGRDELIPTEGQAGDTAGQSNAPAPGSAEQVPAEEEQPADEQQPAGELQPANPEQPAGELQPANPEQPPVDEGQPAEEQPVNEQQPAEGEQPVEPETPAVVPEEGVLPEVPPVLEEEIVPEEVLPEELLEEEVIAEPIPATLTIVQRLMVGETEREFIQMIDGLEVGQVVDLADYIIQAENVLCISEGGQITLSEENTSVILEYNLVQTDEFENLDK